jgi:hypothetical protein
LSTPLWWDTTKNVETVDNCQLVYSMRSPYACPYAKSVEVTPLSPGWIVFIILVVAVAGYLIAGSAYKRYKYGSSGLEAIPNIDIWRRIASFFTCRSRSAGAAAGTDVYTDLKTTDEVNEPW